MNERPDIITRTFSLMMTFIGFIYVLESLLMFAAEHFEIVDNLLDFIGWEGWIL